MDGVEGVLGIVQEAWAEVFWKWFEEVPDKVRRSEDVRFEV